MSKTHVIKDHHHTEAKRIGDGKCRIVFWGATTTGTAVKFKVEIPFEHLGYAMHEVRKAWSEEKQSRERTIQSIESEIR